MERERRSTAGVRMSSLVGQAANDDEEFWNHSTWVEDEDASFHDSDEESEARKDTFDSDFDDSEEEGDGDGGNDTNQASKEEAEILREERREKQKRASSKRKIVDVVSAGRELIQKRRNAVQRKKALRGDGMNAGLVLNVPGSTPGSALGAVGVSRKFGSVVPPQQKKVDTTKAASAVAGSPERKSARVRTSKFDVAIVFGPTKRTTGKRSLRVSKINNSVQTEHQRQVTSSSIKPTTAGGGGRGGGKKGKRKFTQEELILEAVQSTEAENKRWLLSRKRSQMEEVTRAELSKKLGNKSGDRKVICKYNSKRGCYNTLTFPLMDHLPELFSRPRVDESQRQIMLKQLKKENVCVITGKKARYRDPKTGKGYHDLAAFKELRRRFDAGERLETCPVLSEEANVEKKLQKNEKEAKLHIGKELQKNHKTAKVTLKSSLQSKKEELSKPQQQPDNISSSQPSISSKQGIRPTTLNSNQQKQKTSKSLTKKLVKATKNPPLPTTQTKGNEETSITITSKKDPPVKIHSASKGQIIASTSKLKQQQQTLSTPKISLPKQIITASTLKSKKEMIRKHEIGDKSLSVTSKCEKPNLSNHQLATPTKSNVTKPKQKQQTSIRQQSMSKSSKNLSISIKKTLIDHKSGSESENKIPTKINNIHTQTSTSSLSGINNAVVPDQKFSKVIPRETTISSANTHMPSTKQQYVAPSSINNMHLNPNMQQFMPSITPQYTPNHLSQQYPMVNPAAMYHNTMNPMAGAAGAHPSYYNPNPFELASLYAMSLSQQQQNTPLQSSMFYNNTYNHATQNSQPASAHSNYSSVAPPSGANEKRNSTKGDHAQERIKK